MGLHTQFLPHSEHFSGLLRGRVPHRFIAESPPSAARRVAEFEILRFAAGLCSCRIDFPALTGYNLMRHT